MKAIKEWEEEFDKQILYQNGKENGRYNCMSIHDEELHKNFIQSLLDKQKEEILLIISNSYVNSIYTPINDCTRLWRNELIKQIKEM